MAICPCLHVHVCHFYCASFPLQYGISLNAIDDPNGFLNYKRVAPTATPSHNNNQQLINSLADDGHLSALTFSARVLYRDYSALSTYDIYTRK